MPELHAFIADYYIGGLGATYSSDYFLQITPGLPNEYLVPDTWETFDRVAAIVDERYAAWLARPAYATLPNMKRVLSESVESMIARRPLLAAEAAQSDEAKARMIAMIEMVCDDQIATDDSINATLDQVNDMMRVESERGK